ERHVGAGVSSQVDVRGVRIDAAVEDRAGAAVAPHQELRAAADNLAGRSVDPNKHLVQERVAGEVPRKLDGRATAKLNVGRNPPIAGGRLTRRVKKNIVSREATNHDHVSVEVIIT